MIENIKISLKNKQDMKSVVQHFFINYFKENRYKEKETNEYIKRFACFIKVLKLRIRQEWDNVIAITGEEGVGKSTLAYWIAKFLDNKFSFERNYLLTNDINEIEEKLKDKTIKVIVVDEAIKQFYKLEWSSPFQRYLNKLYAVAREARTTTILCMPRFTDFNEFFRNHRIRFWLHCVSRGCAILFVPDWNPFSKDPWWIDYNQKLITKIFKYTPLIKIGIEKKLKVLRRSVNFVTELYYPPMPKEDKKLYKEIISSRKFDTLKEKEEEKASVREMKLKLALSNVISYLHFKKKMSLSSIARKLGIGSSTVKNYLLLNEKAKQLYEKKMEEKKATSEFDKLPFL